MTTTITPHMPSAVPRPPRHRPSRRFRETQDNCTHGLLANKKVMTSACGNRTLTPYTSPLRAPLRIASRSWFAGLALARAR